jgi:hypothetical protein
LIEVQKSLCFEQEFCHQEGIQYMGYSTLGSQWLMRGVSTNPVLLNAFDKSGLKLSGLSHMSNTSN